MICTPSLDDNTADHSRLETTDNQSTAQSDIKRVNDNNHQLNTNGSYISREESNPLPNITSVKEGDLTVI